MFAVSSSLLVSERTPCFIPTEQQSPLGTLRMFQELYLRCKKIEMQVQQDFSNHFFILERFKHLESKSCLFL